MTHTDEEADKVRENRLRRMAKRQGLYLTKSRRRDPRAIDYGGWYITEANRNLSLGENLDLDEIEAYLTGED